MSFAIGQVWTFPEREGCPQLIVTIGRIDAAQDLGADASNSSVISVSMSPSDDARELDWPAVEHTPISEAAFNADRFGELVMDGVTPPEGFEEGYKTWRSAFDQGNAGVFAVSPPEAYSAVLQIFADRG